VDIFIFDAQGDKLISHRFYHFRRGGNKYVFTFNTAAFFFDEGCGNEALFFGIKRKYPQPG